MWWQAWVYLPEQAGELLPTAQKLFLQINSHKALLMLYYATPTWSETWGNIVQRTGRSSLLAIGVYSVAVMSFCELGFELAFKIVACWHNSSVDQSPLSHGMVIMD